MKKPQVKLLLFAALLLISGFLAIKHEWLAKEFEIGVAGEHMKGEEGEEGEEEYEDEGDRKDEAMREKVAGVNRQMETWFQARGWPYPYNLNQNYKKGWETAEAIRNYTLTRTSNTNRTAAGAWVSLGPKTNIGGRMLSIAVNPVKSTSVWVGSAGGGIWKSYNGASNWSPVTTDFPILGVPSIIINPADTMIMYAGTGEVYRVDSTGTTPNPGNTGMSVRKTRGTYG